MPDTPTPPPTPSGSRAQRLRGGARGLAGRAARSVGRGAKQGGAAWAGWTRRRWSAVRDGDASTPKRVLNALGLGAGLGATAGAALTLLVLLYALALWPFTPGVRSLVAAHEADPAVVLSADGETLTSYTRRGREWVGLDDVSEPVVQALLATEDRRFYRHGGIDVIRLGGAVARTLGGTPQGGSTITQQLARNLFPEAVGRQRSVTRKLKEAITALKIERVYEKDQILEIYLNTVPFLYDATGIERAAQTYFSTSAADLDPAQAATLVAMLKGTSTYNPKRHPERARERRDLVLALMERDGYLSAEQADAYQARDLGLQFRRLPIRRSSAPHFTEHVRVWLEDWCRRNACNPYGDGLRVHTSLDARLQRAATSSVTAFGNALQKVADVEWSRRDLPRLGETTTGYVRAHASAEPWAYFWASQTERVDGLIRSTDAFRRAVRGGRTGEAALDSLRAVPAFMDSLRAVKTRLEVSFVALDPGTGHVKAWVGSRDWSRRPFDHVAASRRQPGSTFKPFVYAQALQEGWHPDDVLRDDAVEIALANDRVWAPTDPGGPTGRPYTLRDGLARSRNTIAAQLVASVGPRDVARLARRMGVESELEAVPSLALGTSDVSLLEMASAYGTFAAAGVRRPPVFVTRIERRDGTVLAEFAPEGRQALPPQTALAVVDMMRGVVDRGTGQQLRSKFDVRGDLAGKTGTTQDGADGWFFLLHPDLVMGAWVGFDDPRVSFRSSYWEQGGHNALRVVAETAERAQRDGLMSRTARFETPTFTPRGGLLRRFERWIGTWGDEPEPRPQAEATPPDGWDETDPYDATPRGENSDRRPEDVLGDAVADAVAGGLSAALEAQLREAERWAEDALREPDPETQERFEEVAREIEREADEVRRELERALRRATR